MGRYIVVHEGGSDYGIQDRSTGALSATGLDRAEAEETASAWNAEKAKESS